MSLRPYLNCMQHLSLGNLLSRVSQSRRKFVCRLRALMLLFSNLSFAENLYRFYWPGSDRLPLACARALAVSACLDILSLCFASFLFFELLFCGFWSSSRFCQYGFRNLAGSK